MGSICILSTCLIVGVSLGLVVYWFRMWPTRRRATLTRLFRDFSVAHKRPPTSPPGTIKVLMILGPQKVSQGIFSTCLFCRSSETFRKRYMDPLLSTVKKLPPGWLMRVHVPCDMSPFHIGELLNAGCEIYVMSNPVIQYEPFFWRFLPLLGKTPFFCCDADTEPDCLSDWNDVEEWLQDPRAAFVHYKVPILNRMWPITAPNWGCKPQFFSSEDRERLKKALESTVKSHTDFGCDELFLVLHLQPLFQIYGVKTHSILPWIEPSVVGLVLVLIVGVLSKSTK